MRLGDAAVNPCKRVSKPVVHNEIVKYLAIEQERTLFGLLPLRYVPVSRLALYCGCRQGELLRLRWGDWNRERGTLAIRDTKSGILRVIPLNTIAAKVLEEAYANAAPLPGDKIFKIDDRALRRAFTRACERAGLQGFSFHGLRHTFASRLAMAGVNHRSLMELGGWKSVSMLARYSHLQPSALQSATEKMTQFQVQGVTKCVTTTQCQEVDCASVVEIYGEPRAPRTHDPRLKRAMLYQLS